MQKDFFSSDKYKSKKYSMSILKANLVALIYPLPFELVFIAAYIASGALRPGSTGGIFLSFSGNPLAVASCLTVPLFF